MSDTKCLSDLIALANELAADKRLALLQELGILFLKNARSYSVRERELLGAIIGRMAASLSASDRCELALTLAPSVETQQVQSATLANAIDWHRPAILEDAAVLPEEQLVAFLRDGQVEEFVAHFAALTGLTPDGASRAICDESGEALVAACKRAGFERATYSAIVVLSDPLGRRAPERTEAMLALYDKVPADQITYAAA